LTYITDARIIAPASGCLSAEAVRVVPVRKLYFESLNKTLGPCGRRDDAAMRQVTTEAKTQAGLGFREPLRYQVAGKSTKQTK
jgi:hypothetical protein